MRKYKVRIDHSRSNPKGEIQTIIADSEDKAREIAKTNLGLKKNAIVMNWTREFYNDNLEDLKARCEAVKTDKTIEVVAMWYGCKGVEPSLEILVEDEYWDRIYFEDREVIEQVYDVLKKYNREITPLEKYHASF